MNIDEPYNSNIVLNKEYKIAFYKKARGRRGKVKSICFGKIVDVNEDSVLVATILSQSDGTDSYYDVTSIRIKRKDIINAAQL